MMEGRGEDPWFVRESLLGLTFNAEDKVSKIHGSDGLSVYYNPLIMENEYLDGLTYDLLGSGKLIPLNAIVTTDLDYYLDITLGETIAFDYWWQMDTLPPDYVAGEHLFDVLALQGGEGWQFIGQIAAYESSTGWERGILEIPEELRGMETQIRFVLSDYYPETNPFVYLTNVPEPTTIFLIGTGLVGLVGFRRKLQKGQLNSS